MGRRLISNDEGPAQNDDEERPSGVEPEVPDAPESPLVKAHFTQEQHDTKDDDRISDDPEPFAGPLRILGCFRGTFSPSLIQIRSTLL